MPMLLVGVWLVGAVATTGTGLLAVRLVGSQVGDPASVPLSAAGVDRALAESTPEVPADELPAVPEPTATALPDAAVPGGAGEPEAPAPPVARSTAPRP